MSAGSDRLVELDRQLLAERAPMNGRIELRGQPVFLIGYRGTGKSAVAGHLAAPIGYEAVDADDIVEARAGKSIAQIFAEDGESTFRDLESAVVAELCGRRQIVAALGGGAVLREANRNAICAAGPVVWLTASVGTILQRIAADMQTASRRPKLTKVSDRAEIEQMMAAREPLYRECATLVVDTERKSAADVAAEIAAKF